MSLEFLEESFGLPPALCYEPIVEDLCLGEMLAFCAQRLPAAKRKVLEQLAQRSDLGRTLGVDIEAGNLLELEQRLDEVERNCFRDGRAHLPARVIDTVCFDPFNITYVRAGISGSAYRFYIENIDRYGGLNRAGLAAFDRGLYDALLEEETLGTAIPEHREVDFEALSDEQRREVVLSYERFRGNAARAGRELGYDRRTVIGIWKSSGFVTGLGLLPFERAEIIAAHGVHGEIVSEAKRHMTYGYHTIRRVWREEGLALALPKH